MPCGGKINDTHLHLEVDERGPDELLESVAARMATRMAEHDVGCAVAFYGFEGLDPLEEELGRLLEAAGPNPGRFIPFYDLGPDRVSDVKLTRLEEILGGTEEFVSLRGYGESAFYRHPWRGTTLTDAPWPYVYDIAEREDQWLRRVTPAENHAV